ncbi:MAG: 50S ribosomal protein L15 [Clostridiales bacterium]|nr:50S ribosomal protein L15 [Clostridiales bacterium]
MKLHELSPAAGSVKKSWRVGRGIGSGNGKTSGRGHKGQKARSGASIRRGFEGGQLPLYRKHPKKGFTPFAPVEYAIVNLNTLNKYENGAVIDLESLMADGVVRKPLAGLKVLANGELKKQLTVKATKFSAAAKEKIEAAGGKAEEV